MKNKLLLCSLTLAGMQSLSSLSAQNCQANFTSAVNTNTVTFANNSTGGTGNISYVWDYGDGTSSYGIIPAPHAYYNGTYNACLFVSDSLANCWSSFCDSIVITGGVNPPCNVSISDSVYNASCDSCADGSVYIQASGGAWPYSFVWNTGQTGYYLSGLSAGTYSVCVTDANGCTACTSVQVNVNPPCIISAGFTLNTANDPLIAFTNTSTGTGQLFYSWNFGDGEYSSQTNPTNNFFYNDTYEVCLTVWDNANYCEATSCQYVTITNANSLPDCDLLVAGFTVNTSNDPQVSFTNTSTGFSLLSYTWNFGDGNYSFDMDPIHTYQYNGEYIVSLFVSDDNGQCYDYILDTITINNTTPEPCIAAFVDSMDYFGNSVAFYDYSSGNPTAWFWDFGDGTSSTQQYPYHSYAQPGTYTVCLTITTPVGTCSTCNSLVITNVPSGPCNVSLNIYQDSLNTSVWYAYPSVTGTAPFTYLWSFGDGNVSTEQYPSHTYTATGIYNVCLTITDATGCTSTSCDSTYKVTGTSGVQHLIAVDSTSTGIEEHKISVSSIFPNPSSDQIEVSLSQSTEGQLTITDVAGRQVYSENINADKVKVTVSNLPAGFYNLSILSGSKASHNKIMIAR